MLQDYAFGTGVWALLLRLHNDYTGIKNLVVGVTVRYDRYPQDHETVRVPDSVDSPLTANKETVTKDIADVFEFEPTIPLSVGVSYRNPFAGTDALRSRNLAGDLALYF